MANIVYMSAQLFSHAVVCRTSALRQLLSNLFPLSVEHNERFVTTTTVRDKFKFCGQYLLSQRFHCIYTCFFKPIQSFDGKKSSCLLFQNEHGTSGGAINVFCPVNLIFCCGEQAM